MNKLNKSLTEAKFNEMKDIKENLEDEVTKLQLFYKEQDLLLGNYKIKSENFIRLILYINFQKKC